MNIDIKQRLMIALARRTPAEQRDWLSRCRPGDRLLIDAAFEAWAEDGQMMPPADGWRVWLMMAGRGYGKTRAGAEWIHRLAITGGKRIALVAASIDEARSVMVEGASGLLAIARRTRTRVKWEPSLGRLTWPRGSQAQLFSGDHPDGLRGPEHDYAWCDELAKWDRGEETWDMLQMGLRLGDNPQAVVTTTPRPGPVLRAIMASAETVVTGGPTRANPHLSATWRARIEAAYAGTRLGRQELDGELLPEAAGALWTVELIEKCRVSFETVSQPVASIPPQDERIRYNPDHPEEAPKSKTEVLSRRIIAVDPPSGAGTCGIVACARDAAGIAHVLADHSVTARSPEGWARAVAAAAAAHATCQVVAEANQGGKMVKAVLMAADPTLHVRLVHARVGKSHRAEPVAHLFEAGKVRLHGRMPELEAQLLGMIAGGGYEGPGVSPDRADAMVWGVSEVMREWGVRVSLG